MSYGKPTKRSLTWDPKWNIDLLKDKLKEHKYSLREICRDIAPSMGTSHQGLYHDTQRWREMDSDLQRLIDENAAALGNTVSKKAGRKRKDVEEGDLDWRLSYVKMMLSTNDRKKAADATPYEPSYIQKMLKKGNTEFDQLFFDMVEAAEMQLVDKASAAAFNALDNAVLTGASPKDIAYIALGILKTHGKGWQQAQKLDVNVSGAVKFQIDRDRQVVELLADQQRFFANTRPLAIASGEPVIEAEEVPS